MVSVRRDHPANNAGTTAAVKHPSIAAKMRASLIPTCMAPVWAGHRFALAPLSCRSVSCEAKKGKKKGGKKGAKKSGGLLGDVPKLQPWQKTEVIMQHLLMIESYRCGSFLSGIDTLSRSQRP